jgi:hypothetical protein
MKIPSGVFELLLAGRLKAEADFGEGEFLHICLRMCTNGRVV